MIRLFHVYFPSRILVLAFSEALLIVLALVSASIYWTGGATALAPGYEGNIVGITLATVVVVLCMHYYDLYGSMSSHRQSEVFARLVQVSGLTGIVLGCLYYAYPPVVLGRGYLIIWLVSTAFISIAWRRLFLAVTSSSQLLQRTLLLGSGRLALPLLSELEARPEFGMSVVGYLRETDVAQTSIDGLPCLGNAEELPALIRREHIRRVILTSSDLKSELNPGYKPAPVSRLKGIAVLTGADVYEAITGKVCLNSFDPARLMFPAEFRISRRLLFYKRTASIIISLCALIPAAPIMLLVAILIRLDSRGPVIFRQSRVGKGGRMFTIFKFRSMHVGADAGGPPRPAMQVDNRITRVGRWLRRLRIDELPQLFNILIGDMDLIGPRPFTPHEETEFEKRIPSYAQRWLIKPGATGWAQVNRGYCTSLADNVEKLSYDLFYIKNLSIGLDCLILFQSFKILLLGRGGQ